MEQYILSLDQGTSSSRAIVFDRKGQICSMAQREFTQIFPKPGWVEHNPHEIWSSQASVIAEAIAAIDINGLNIAGIGITNQRETTIVWDSETEEPVYNAIVWQDRRTSEYCDRLKAEGQTEFIRERTGLIVDAYFSATKIKWILDNVPGARERAEKGKLMGYDNKMLREFTEMARKEPKRVVFAEANHANMLQAASTAMKEGICKPILLGNDELIGKLAESIGVDLSGMQIINLRHPNEEDRRIRYAQLLTEKRQREGMTYAEAHEKMFDRNYFGMMMVEAGEADAFITGTYSKYAETIQIAKEVIGIREGYKHFGAMHIMNTKCGTYFLADTLINRKPTTETLIDIAKLSYDSVRFFAKDPVIAMVSYSNFGSDNQGSPLRVHEAIKILHEQYPEIIIDGEMQMNFALNNKLRDKSYPFNKLKGREVNTIVFPNLSSANSAYKMMLEMGVAESIGPIQMGLNKPIHFTDIASSTRDIVNLTTVAVLDAIVQERRNKQ